MASQRLQINEPSARRPLNVRPTHVCAAHRVIERPDHRCRVTGAKVDCIRVAHRRRDAVADARRHIDIALDHLRAGTVRVIVVGGCPGSGKTTLSRALAQEIGAQVISTDDVRRELQHAGAVAGQVGELNDGLYTPENVSAVYDEVLRHGCLLLSSGSSVILDGTWRDPRQRERAREIASETSSPIVEFRCSLPLEQASARIEGRRKSTSDATPEIAAALADSTTSRKEATRSTPVGHSPSRLRKPSRYVASRPSWQWSSVVGVDGSSAAIRAVRWAAAVAERFAAPPQIVHAIPALGHNPSAVDLRLSRCKRLEDEGQHQHANTTDRPPDEQWAGSGAGGHLGRQGEDTAADHRPDDECCQGGQSWA